MPAPTRALVVDAGPLRGDDQELREGAQVALRLRRPQQATGDRGGVGRGDRRQHEVQGEGAAEIPRAPPLAGAPDEILLRRRHGIGPRSIPAIS